MEFHKRKLKNNMIVLFEKRDLPLVSMSISNRFGGAYEESNVKGIAHFIEHLVFTGTKTRTHEDISKEIEKKGGVLNAFTANEVTSYWFKLPSGHIFSGLEILSDILNNPKFEKEKFEKEKKVILEEIKMYRDDPQRFVHEKIEEALYESPFGEGIIGTEQTIKNLDRDFVYDFFKKAYNSSNYIVTIVGNVDINKTCSFLESRFKETTEKIEKKEIVKKNDELIIEREGIDQANLILGMHSPLPQEDEFYTLQVLHAYLADGMSSKLFLKIREEKGLAYTIKGGINAEKTYAYYTIYVGTVKGAVNEVKKLIIEEFQNVREMTIIDLEEAKERLVGLKKVRSEESISVMNELLFSELSGNAEDYYNFEKEIQKVKLEDVKKLAKELIKEYSIAMVVPK